MIEDIKLERKAKNQFGVEYVDEMCSMDDHALKMLISSANRETLETKAELEMNENYKKAKEDMKHLSEGFREVKKINNLKIALAHALLNSRGVA